MRGEAVKFLLARVKWGEHVGHELDVVLDIFIDVGLVRAAIQGVGRGEVLAQREFLVLGGELEEVDGVLDGVLLVEEECCLPLAVEADVEVAGDLLHEEVSEKLATLAGLRVDLHHVVQEEELRLLLRLPEVLGEEQSLLDSDVAPISHSHDAIGELQVGEAVVHLDHFYRELAVLHVGCRIRDFHNDAILALLSFEEQSPILACTDRYGNVPIPVVYLHVVPLKGLLLLPLFQVSLVVGHALVDGLFRRF